MARFQYAAKFFCTATIPGTSQKSVFPPGSYSTVVNIHNPHYRKVKFRMKLAQPGQISKWISGVLKDDQVIRVSCADIKKFGVGGVHGFEGFLVLESTYSLDLTAVYTATGKNGFVVSMDVEEIKERRVRKA